MPESFGTNETLIAPASPADCSGPSAPLRVMTLFLALGLAPVMDNEEPLHVATVSRMLETCKRHGVVAGIHTGSSRFTQRYIDQGFQMVMLIADRVAMSSWVKAEAARLTGWTPLAPLPAR